MSQREWFRFVNKAEEPNVAHLYIYDAIGPWYMGDDPVSAKRFIDQLKGLAESIDTIRVHISSPGGYVDDALAIANSLRMHRARVETSIEGMAASAATIVSSVGEKISIFDNASVMIHNPYAIVLGNAKHMRKVADDLDRARDQIVTTYRLNSKLEPEALAELMEAETWMTADEAIANGFAHEKVTGLKVAACLRPEVLDRFTSIPAGHRAAVEALIARPAASAKAGEPNPKTGPEAESVEPDEDGNCPDGYEKGEDGMCHLAGKAAKARATQPAVPAAIIRACKKAGLPELAEDLLDQPMEVVTARLAERTQAKARHEAWEREVRAICASAKVPADMTNAFISGGTPVDQVKAIVTAATSMADKVEIDGGLPTEAGKQKAAVNVSSFYDRLNVGRS